MKAGVTGSGRVAQAPSGEHLLRNAVPGFAIQQTQTPHRGSVGRLSVRALAMTYFLTGNPQYHRRDVVSRSCSGWEGVGPTRYGRQEFGSACSSFRTLTRNGDGRISNWFMHCIVCVVLATALHFDAQGYRVKPHGQLVPVSSTHYCAYTPGLSTSSSTTALKGELVSRWVSRLDAFSDYPVRT